MHDYRFSINDNEFLHDHQSWTLSHLQRVYFPVLYRRLSFLLKGAIMHFESIWMILQMVNQIIRNHVLTFTYSLSRYPESSTINFLRSPTRWFEISHIMHLYVHWKLPKSWYDIGIDTWPYNSGYFGTHRLEWIVLIFPNTILHFHVSGYFTLPNE